MSITFYDRWALRKKYMNLTTREENCSDKAQLMNLIEEAESDRGGQDRLLKYISRLEELVIEGQSEAEVLKAQNKFLEDKIGRIGL